MEYGDFLSPEVNLELNDWLHAMVASNHSTRAISVAMSYSVCDNETNIPE
jgi:hypothetical protein